MKNSGSICKMMINGTDFVINEPIPFSKNWFTKKVEGPGTRHKVGVCIQTGWTHWWNGPFPCGAWPDLKMSREELICRPHMGRSTVANKGCHRSWLHVALKKIASADRVPAFERMMAAARARHETINRKPKELGCLQKKWRYPKSKHHITFGAVANIVQLTIMEERSACQVACDG